MFRCTDSDHTFDYLKQYIEAGNSIQTNDIMVEPLICSASISGHVKCLELLLKSGANVNSQDYSGETPLYLESQYGHRDCVHILLKAGANTRCGSQIVCLDSLEVAIAHGHKDCAYVLIDHGMKFNKEHMFMMLSRYGEFMDLASQDIIDQVVADVEPYIKVSTIKIK